MNGLDSGLPSWVTPAIAVLSLLLGSGGIVAYWRLRLDRQMGVSASEVAEDDAVVARWQMMVEAQTKSLVEPLQKRLAEVEREVRGCEEAQRQINEELVVFRRKYWQVVDYTRRLVAWAREVAPGVEPPPVPTEIAEDI